MPPEPEKPFPAFRFRVEIDGVAVADFVEVSGLSAEIDVIEYRVGSDPAHRTRKLPGLVKYSNVVLKRGITKDDTLFKWFSKWMKGEGSPLMMRIMLLSEEGIEVRGWNLFNAWPTKYVGPTLNAQSQDVAIETLEIAHEGIE